MNSLVREKIKLNELLKYMEVVDIENEYLDY